MFWIRRALHALDLRSGGADQARAARRASDPVMFVLKDFVQEFAHICATEQCDAEQNPWLRILELYIYYLNEHAYKI